MINFVNPHLILNLVMDNLYKEHPKNITVMFTDDKDVKDYLIEEIKPNVFLISLSLNLPVNTSVFYFTEALAFVLSDSREKNTMFKHYFNEIGDEFIRLNELILNSKINITIILDKLEEEKIEGGVN